MARALLVAQRTGAPNGPVPYVDLLNRRLSPDNVIPRNAAVAHDHGVTAVVFDASSATQLCAGSICLGTLFGSTTDWHKLGSERPDGCYALLRADAAHIELLADATASRTIWYAMTPDLFVASTSQRAIVALLGSFEPSSSAVAWMLSSGTLGPEAGWDARLRQVLPGERVTLDRQHWRLTYEVAPIHFESSGESDSAYYAKELRDALERVCDQFVFDTSKWAFLLSGGIDSRGLLSLLGARPGVRTITWGLRTSQREAWNDARIARSVASEFGLENRFFPTDLPDEPREGLIRRFLTAGEGRIANISPFLDGFSVWQTLRQEGLEGVIRGDVAFGSRFVRNAYEVRHAAKLTMLADYFDDREMETLGLPEQGIPTPLAQRQAETLAAWRDRLYQQNRLPRFLAALTDLQSPYVEVVNPLLAGTILRCIRHRPDELRTGKRLWREVAQSRGVTTPLARRPAVLPLQRFVTDTPLLTLMLAEMETVPEGAVLSPALRAAVRAAIRTALAANTKRRARTSGPRFLSLIAPDFVRYAARRWIEVRPQFEPLVFAFRAFIVARMNALLRSDAKALAAEPRRAATL
jgi:hypothetical protein